MIVPTAPNIGIGAKKRMRSCLPIVAVILPIDSRKQANPAEKRHEAAAPIGICNASLSMQVAMMHRRAAAPETACKPNDSKMSENLALARITARKTSEAGNTDPTNAEGEVSEHDRESTEKARERRRADPMES